MGDTGIGDTGNVDVGIVDMEGRMLTEPMLPRLKPYTCCSFGYDVHG